MVIDKYKEMNDHNIKIGECGLIQGKVLPINYSSISLPYYMHPYHSGFKYMIEIVTENDLSNSVVKFTICFQTVFLKTKIMKIYNLVLFTVLYASNMITEKE